MVVGGVNGLNYLFLCAVIVIVVLAWDSRHHQARWDKEDDE